MKVKFNDEFSFVVFLNKFYKLDYKNDIESNIKDLILRLEKYYNIYVNGLYDIKIFSDSNYGIILDIKKEENDYIDCLYNQIDMRIVLKENSCFLYEFNDFDILKNIDIKDIYIYKNKLYFSLNSDHLIESLIEHTNIIYGTKAEKIVNNGKKIMIRGEKNEKANNSTSGKT